VLLEPVGDVLGVQRAAVGPGEDVAVVAVAASDRLAVLSLELALCFQRRERDRIEGEAASAPLGLAAESCTWWSTTTRGMVGETVAWSKSMSTQRSPASYATSVGDRSDVSVSSCA
jgi:hypothetical protein